MTFSRLPHKGSPCGVIMPDKPYLPVGTLRQALIYPQVDSRLTSDGTDMHWDQNRGECAQRQGCKICQEYHDG